MISPQYVDGLEQRIKELSTKLEQAEARVAELEGRTCRTCDGHGIIGGPMSSAPDDGGETCPDCSAWLLRKQAEAVEEAYKSTVLTTSGNPKHHDEGFEDATNQYDDQMSRYVDYLRQQADELERS